MREGPAPCIVTCRSVAEGGGWSGDRSALETLLSGLCCAAPRPRWIDVEFVTWRDGLAQVLGPLDGDPPGRILSFHDPAGRPTDLRSTIEAMTARDDVDVLKIAWTAGSLRDNLEALDLLADRDGPTVALCMGPMGLLSRVLAPKFGGLLTFAAPAEDAATAPGQPTVMALRDRYRFDAIGPSTSVYGILGWPVDHSPSPATHNACFEAVGHDGVFLPMPVAPGWESFRMTLAALLDHPGLDFRGASVTLPHKANLLRFVHEHGGRVDEAAARIGAANTLVVARDGSLACLNTDAPGTLEALADAVGGVAALAGKRAAVIGAGGVARAIVAVLVDAGVEVVVVNRTRAGADELADALGAQAADPSVLAEGGFDLLCNATSLGMTGGPDPDASPLDLAGAPVPLDDSVIVFDAVAAPPRTPLVRAAEAAGARVVLGTDLFVRQAVHQFSAWTGLDAPRAVLARAAGSAHE